MINWVQEMGYIGLKELRIMKDEGFVNERPIEVIVFMGEEGLAFKKTLLGSAVMAGNP